VAALGADCRAWSPIRLESGTLGDECLKRGGAPAASRWWALYAATLAALVAFRLVVPVAQSLRHGLHVERVVQKAPGVVFLQIGGRRGPERG
jgi:hypothetical protein